MDLENLLLSPEAIELLKSLDRRKHMNTQTGEILDATQEEVDALNKETKNIVSLSVDEALKYRSLAPADRPIARQFDKLLSTKKRNQLTARQIFIAGYKAALADNNIRVNPVPETEVKTLGADDSANQAVVSNEN